MGQIEGVWTKTLKVIPDERGRLMEILRADDEGFRSFGQVYMTTNYPGVVKAWHRHEKQEDMVACVKGMIKLVLYDPRPDSPSTGTVNEFFIGEHNPMLVRVPAGVYHGWKGISEEHRLPWDTPEIPYDWDIVFK
jgi:dTDP-4-dehydrorhamnose 3,5-epimerase